MSAHLREAWGLLVVGYQSEFISNLPIQYDPRLPNEASVGFPDDVIKVGPKFYELSEAGQEVTLWHEAAHLYKLDDLWLDVNITDWNLAAKMKYGNLNGQTTPGEIVAEAYSVLMGAGGGASVLDDYSYPGFAAEIVGLARTKGLPTP